MAILLCQKEVSWLSYSYRKSRILRETGSVFQVPTSVFSAFFRSNRVFFFLSVKIDSDASPMATCCDVRSQSKGRFTSGIGFGNPKRERGTVRVFRLEGAASFLLYERHGDSRRFCGVRFLRKLAHG